MAPKTAEETIPLTMAAATEFNNDIHGFVAAMMAFNVDASKVLVLEPPETTEHKQVLRYRLREVVDAGAAMAVTLLKFQMAVTVEFEL
jgi:hypothetical protein